MHCWHRPGKWRNSWTCCTTLQTEGKDTYFNTLHGIIYTQHNSYSWTSPWLSFSFLIINMNIQTCFSASWACIEYCVHVHNIVHIWKKNVKFFITQSKMFLSFSGAFSRISKFLRPIPTFPDIEFSWLFQYIYHFKIPFCWVSLWIFQAIVWLRE